MPLALLIMEVCLSKWQLYLQVEVSEHKSFEIHIFGLITTQQQPIQCCTRGEKNATSGCISANLCCRFSNYNDRLCSGVSSPAGFTALIGSCVSRNLTTTHICVFAVPLDSEISFFLL